MSAKQMVLTVMVAALGVGAAVAIAACGDEDRGSLEIEGGTTGTTGTGTSTTPVTVDTSATDPEALDEAMSEVATYARGQTAKLVTATEALRRAVDAGDVAQGKQAYAAARPYYERIEPLVALFPELDGKIDAREDDFPKKGDDPTWTGFHPIERALWKDGEIDARTQAHRRWPGGRRQAPGRADAGRRGPAERRHPRYGRAGRRGRGVEDHRRGGALLQARPADLPGQPRGRPGVLRARSSRSSSARTELLDEQIDSAFDEAFDEVNGLKRDGSFPAYDELSEQQQRTIKQDIEALAEPLARVQGTLGVES